MAFSTVSKAEKLIFSGAVLVRVILLGALIFYFGQNWWLMTPNSTDQFLRLGESIFSGHGFFDPQIGVFESAKAPGYALYLGLFSFLGLPLWFAAILQIILFSFLPVVNMRLVKKLGGSGFAANIVGVLTAFEPLQVLYSVSLMPDALTELFFFAGVYYLIVFWESRRKTDLAVSSVFLAASNYIRPVGVYWIFLVPLFILFYCWKSDFQQRGLPPHLILNVLRSWRRVIPFVLAAGFNAPRSRCGGLRKGLVFAVVFGSIFMIVLTPWFLRNYARFGVWGFSSGSNPYLFSFSAPAVKAAAENRNFHEVQEELRAEAEKNLLESRDLNSFYNEKMLGRKAKEIISAHPYAFVKLYFFSLQTYFMSGNYHYLLKHFGIIDPPKSGQVSVTQLFASRGLKAVWDRTLIFIREPYGMIALLGRIFWSVLFLGSLAGAFMLLRSESGFLKFSASVFLFFIIYGALTVLTAVAGIEARHRLYLNPLIFVFAGISLDWLRVGLKFKNRSMD